MPCNDGGPSYGDTSNLERELAMQQSRLDMYARMLCELCSKINPEVLTQEMKEWWEAHKIQDAERLALEERGRQRREEVAAKKARARKLKLYRQLKEELGF